MKNIYTVNDILHILNSYKYTISDNIIYYNHLYKIPILYIIHDSINVILDYRFIRISFGIMESLDENDIYFNISPYINLDNRDDYECIEHFLSMYYSRDLYKKSLNSEYRSNLFNKLFYRYIINNDYMDLTLNTIDEHINNLDTYHRIKYDSNAKLYLSILRRFLITEQLLN